MTNREAVRLIRNLLTMCEFTDAYGEPIDSDAYYEAVDMVISALQAQDSKTRICNTCKHNPPSKKWPCVDCDMREPADRWEPKDVPDTNVGDTISRQAAIDAVLSVIPYDEYWKEQVERAISALQSAQLTLCGYNIEHLILIANVLREENLPPERVIEALTDIGRIVSIVKDECEKSLRKAVEQLFGAVSETAERRTDGKN